MRYIIHYDIAAIIILIVLAIHFYSKKTIMTKATKVFVVLMNIVLMACIADLITLFTIEDARNCPLWINYVFNGMYFISFISIAMVYMYYLLSIKNNKASNSKKLKTLSAVPGIICIIMTALSPFTKWVFYFDENYEYTHGKFINVLYIVSLIYVVVTWIYMIVNRKIFSNRQVVSVYFYTISALVALAIQIISNRIMVLGFALTLAMVLMYLSLENPLDFVDSRLDIFNKEAFMEVVHNHIDSEKKFQVLAIKIDGLKYVRETLGDNILELLLKEIAKFLKGVIKGTELFYIGHSTFILLGTKDMEIWDKAIKDIKRHFKTKFVIDRMEVNVYEYMSMVAYPDNIARYEDVLDMIKYSLAEASQISNEDIIYAKEDVMLKARRENLVKQAIKKALIEKTFRVHYQPIYSVYAKKYTSAEALLRLIDEELGFVSPDEFIPIAEKTGLILDIGEFVFRDVCKFIKDNKIWELGLEYIDVNLSVVQCMQEKLHETLLKIMDEFELDYQYINLEITETAAALSDKTLDYNMHKLIEKGVRFSLDDYGTGYSNLTNLIKYTFYAIKIDKSMLWTAMEDKKAMYALKHTISMIQEMDMKLVVEGVETKEHAQLLEELGCDFFQGYLYSKPVNETMFLEEIHKMNK